MYRTLSWLAIVLTSVPLLAQPDIPALALTHVNVIDVGRGRVLSDVTVITIGERISAVGPSRQVAPPRGARIIDVSGKFLIPGLWDMHVHAFNDGRFDYVLPLLIANGITGVRDMGTNLPLEEVQRTIRDVIDGRRVGPRFGAWTGRLVDGAESQLRFAQPVGAPAAVRDLVRHSKQHGATFVKTYDLLSPEVYSALADEAKQQGIPFAGHVPFAMTAAQVSDLGQRSIEHAFDLMVSVASNEEDLRREMRQQTGMGAHALRSRAELGAIANYDSQKAASLFARFVRNQTWQCPTIINVRATTVPTLAELTASPRLNYIPDVIRQEWSNTYTRGFLPLGDLEQRNVRFEGRIKITGAMFRAGVGLLAGTDAHGPFNVPGFSLHDELELFVRGGLTPAEALQTATTAPAKFLRQENAFGTVAEGTMADLVLLDANPLESISHTRGIAAVIANGRYYDRGKLDGLMADAQRAARTFKPRR